MFMARILPVLVDRIDSCPSGLCNSKAYIEQNGRAFFAEAGYLFASSSCFAVVSQFFID
jgi:hypothetical protein